jgi:chromosome segregation ATPase
MKAMKDHSDDDGHMNDDHDGKEKMKKKSNNGNAYGKNKAGLEGREFGQARAAEAREQINTHEVELKEAEVKIINGRNRLATIVERFEKSRAANEITEEEYELRKQKITNAENKLRKAEQSLERNREVVVDQKRKLSSIFDK